MAQRYDYKSKSGGSHSGKRGSSYDYRSRTSDSRASSSSTNHRGSSKKRRQAAKKRALGLFAAVVLILIVSVITVSVIVAKTNSYDLIYKGITVYGVDLSGMTEKEAETALEEASERFFNTKKLTITYEGYKVELKASDIDYNIDAAEGARLAMEYGKDESFSVRRKLYTGSAGKIDLEIPVVYDKEAVDAKIAEFASLVEDEISMSNYVISDLYVTVDLGESGLMLDRSTITSDITEMLDKELFETYTAKPVVITPETLDIDAIYEQVHVDPADASLKYVPFGYTEETAADYDLENYSGKMQYMIVPEVVGISFNLESAKAMLASDDAKKYEFPIIKSTPETTKEKIESMIYRDVLGKSTTTLNTGDRNRTTNVKIATSLVNGTEFMPGEIFSYNEVVGPRTVSRGFKDAKIFVGDEVVDGIGGGICQLSSTTYMASLLSNLKQVSRSSHRYAVAYTPLGQDATVAWPDLDYKFANSTEWPIKVSAVLDDDRLTVAIYGTKLDNYTYKLSSTKDSTIEYEEKTEYVALGSEKAIELELTKLGQKSVTGGKVGYKSTTYRITYLDGEEVNREKINNSSYKTQTKITYIAAYLDAAGNPYLDEFGNPIDPNAPIETETETETETGTGTETETETEVDPNPDPDPDPNPDPNNP